VYRRTFLLALASLPPTPLERAEKLEQLRILESGHRVKATVTTHDTIPVDTPADLERVRMMMITQR
jgi:3-deoxy-manno-octulosonate cytidylyltransferase (CMP-KDO synthetase)